MGKTFRAGDSKKKQTLKKDQSVKDGTGGSRPAPQTRKKNKQIVIQFSKSWCFTVLKASAFI